jgi:hypothetical protein
MIKACLGVAFSIVFAISAAAQQVSMNAFAASESLLLKKLVTLRKAQPSLKAEEVAAKANEMLATDGLDFFLMLDSATCTKVRAAYEAQKDRSKPLKVTATLQSSGADKAPITLPEPMFDLDKCRGCYVRFALLEISNNYFVTKVMGANIKFDLPPNLTSTEAWLVDGADALKPVKRWRIPSRLVPISLSHDDNVLYLDLNIPELKDISLAAFGEGVFEFSTRSEAEAGTKAVPVPVADGGRKRITFTRYGKTSTVSYEQTCLN